MKNSPDTLTTMSSVDHRDSLASLLDGEIMQLSRRRDVVNAQLAAMQRELTAIEDAVEICNGSIEELKRRQAGVSPVKTDEDEATT